jgi:hypothetical protein
MREVFCPECLHYRGTERIPNPKSTAWMDIDRPKCAVGKGAEKKDHSCSGFVSDGLSYSGSRQKRHEEVCTYE